MLNFKLTGLQQMLSMRRSFQFDPAALSTVQASVGLRLPPAAACLPAQHLCSTVNTTTPAAVWWMVRDNGRNGSQAVTAALQSTGGSYASCPVPAPGQWTQACVGCVMGWELLQRLCLLQGG